MTTNAALGEAQHKVRKKISVRSRARRVSAAVLAATLLTGMATTTAVASTAVHANAGQDRTALQAAMSELVNLGATGVQVRVHDQQGDWTDSAGVRELNGTAKPPTDGRFRAGSITKTVVSTVVLQLVGEGAFGLDDPVDRYLPQFGLDKRITVRMLLQHSSGIFNYTGEPRPDGTLEPGIPIDGKEFVDARFHTYAPEELVRLALSKPARFAPGTTLSYSNTNYVLAGLLIEKTTGTSYAAQLERRILRPLELRDSVLPGTWPGIPGPHSHGYLRYQDGAEVKVVDISWQNPSWAFSAGEIISTTKDLDTFFSALLGGKLLAPSLLAEMRKTRPTGPSSGYGLGLAQFEAGPACGGTIVGHDGGIHGYSSALFGTADGSKRFEMSVTYGAVAVDPIAFGNAEQKILSTALCGKAAPASAGTSQSLPQPDRF